VKASGRLKQVYKLCLRAEEISLAFGIESVEIRWLLASLQPLGQTWALQQGVCVFWAVVEGKLS
jgi:hypothetical protein